MRAIMCGVLAAVLAVFLAAPALGHDKGTFEHKNTFLRSKVITLHGKRAPGRDIVKYRLRGGKKPTSKQVHRYFEQLRALIGPPAYMSVSARFPRNAPAGTKTATLAPTGLASCIVSRESGGNAQAVNGQYSGIAQWSQEAWERHGGTQYAPTPLGATKQQQLQVLGQGLSRYGCLDWCRYDGC